MFLVCIPFDAAYLSASHILPHVTSWLAPVPASLRLLFFPVVSLAGLILVQVVTGGLLTAVVVALARQNGIGTLPAILAIANPGNVRLNPGIPTASGESGIQPVKPFTSSVAGGNFGALNSTVSNQIGLGAARQLQLALRLNF